MGSLKALMHRTGTGIHHFVHGIGFLLYGVLQKKTSTVSISCYPHQPLPLYTLWNMAQVCGFKLVPYASQGTPARTMLFQDTTIINPDSLPEGASSWINGRCLDIQKSTVANIYTEVTRRDLLVNPKEYHGWIVEKSEQNPAHDGRMFQGPQADHEVIPGRVYERLIDTTTPDDRDVEDLRTVIVGASIPLIYKIRRSIHERFEGYGSRISMASVNEVFSAEEQAEILECAKRIGLDFGEMDILRDRKNGHIYIVDVNKTTVSPPATLPFKERAKALQIVGRAFEAEL